MTRFLSLVLFLAVFLSSCSVGIDPANNANPVVDSEVSATTEVVGTTTLPTITPSQTASPTATFTPTPEPHPMDIRAMQAGSYPGSDILIEEEFSPGGNYRRYYASYLSEGLKIYGLLTIPNAEMPAGGWPAIVFNHGYIPPEQYRTTERYIAYVDRLALSGYVVFRIDYRGHDRSEGEPTGAYGDPGYTIDVLNAVSSLQRHPQVNPDKIGMWGHSLGGFLTLRAMVISDQIKAGVIWAGVVGSYPDLLYNWRRSSGFVAPTPRPGSIRWREYWIALYGSPEENPQFWNSVSANSFLADLSGPVQLHHGTADDTVPLEFSQTLYDQIQSAGGEVEFYTYDWDDHNLGNYFSTAMNRTIEFYDRNLK